MLVMRQPQFEAQDDFGTGSGVPPIPEWQLGSFVADEGMWYPDASSCDMSTLNVFMRLRNVFQEANRTPLAPTRLHDLACFVLHRVLAGMPDKFQMPTPYSACIRYAIALYMFIIQGPTYYSHAVIMHDIVTQYILHLKELESSFHVYDALDVWLHAIGLVAASDTANYQWFANRTGTIITSLGLHVWGDVFPCIKRVLWLDVTNGEAIFCTHWNGAFNIAGWVELEDRG